MKGGRRLAALVVALAVALGGCGAPAGSASVAPLELDVFAAASLRDAMTAAATRYDASHPGVHVTASFDSSTALRTQIEQGAPADVFASADTTNPQHLVDAGLAVGPVTSFARNSLVIVVADSSRTRVRDPRDLATPGVRIAAAGPDVPITRYADQVVAGLARLPGYPPDYVAAVSANVVSREDNVRAALAKVELGEADAAIVYETDARSSKATGRVEIPAAANVVATYGAVAVTASRHRAEAAAFVAWLGGAEGTAALAPFGFAAPSP
ncbi:MAG TPA: molybdate ABC transporter substrate-binding protein [Candidatus Limnocylindrales bacterium]